MRVDYYTCDLCDVDTRQEAVRLAPDLQLTARTRGRDGTYYSVDVGDLCVNCREKLQEELKQFVANFMQASKRRQWGQGEVERRGARWRVRWWENGRHRSKSGFVDRPTAERFLQVKLGPAVPRTRPRTA